MILGGHPRIPAPLPLLSAIAADPELDAVVVLTADETVVEVAGWAFVGPRVGAA